MDLIEENLGVRLEKKRQRIRLASDDSGDDESRGSPAGSGDELPDIDRRAESRAESDESDVNEFIVDEEGKPIERKQKKKRHIFDDSARQLAEDIFGVAFDYEEFEQYDKDSDASVSDEDYEDEDDED